MPDMSKFKTDGLGRAMERTAVEFVKDIYRVLLKRADGNIPPDQIIQTAATIAASWDGRISQCRKKNGPIMIGKA